MSLLPSVKKIIQQLDGKFRKSFPPSGLLCPKARYDYGNFVHIIP
jgi:hypothetical protein